MEFGEFQGWGISALPTSYLCWLLDVHSSSAGLKALALSELKSRMTELMPAREPVKASDRFWLVRFLEAGHRALTEHHARDATELKHVNQAANRFRSIFGTK
jgi:hypothetical protein